MNERIVSIESRADPELSAEIEQQIHRKDAVLVLHLDAAAVAPRRGGDGGEPQPVAALAGLGQPIPPHAQLAGKGILDAQPQHGP